MWSKDVQYLLCMKFDVCVGWCFGRGVGEGFGRGIVDEVDIGVGGEIYSLVEI